VWQRHVLDRPSSPPAADISCGAGRFEPTRSSTYRDMKCGGRYCKGCGAGNRCIYHEHFVEVCGQVHLG
jgi:hypothetical protein